MKIMTEYKAGTQISLWNRAVRLATYHCAVYFGLKMPCTETDTCGTSDNCTAVVIHKPATCILERSIFDKNGFGYNYFKGLKDLIYL